MSLLGNVEDLQSHSDQDQEALRAMQGAAEAAASREQQLQEQLRVLQQHSRDDQEALQETRTAAEAAAVCEQQLLARIQDLQHSTDAAAACKQDSETAQHHDDDLQSNDKRQAHSSFHAAAASLAAADRQVSTQICHVTQTTTDCSSLLTERLSNDQGQSTVSEASPDPEDLKGHCAEVMQGDCVEQPQQRVSKATASQAETQDQQYLDGNQAPDTPGHAG